MSRYLLLLLFNIPFILAGIITALTQYKLGQGGKGRLVFQVGFWLALFICLALAQPIYEALFINKLTQTESLSLFDVVQITLIVTLMYIVNRLRLKVEVIDKRARDLHQELSIKLSAMHDK